MSKPVTQPWSGGDKHSESDDELNNDASSMDYMLDVEKKQKKMLARHHGEQEDGEDTEVKKDKQQLSEDKTVIDSNIIKKVQRESDDDFTEQLER